MNPNLSSQMVLMASNVKPPSGEIFTILKSAALLLTDCQVVKNMNNNTGYKADRACNRGDRIFNLFTNLSIMCM
jgi:hypothetical protein